MSIWTLYGQFFFFLYGQFYMHFKYSRLVEVPDNQVVSTQLVSKAIEDNSENGLSPRALTHVHLLAGLAWFPIALHRWGIFGVAEWLKI